MGTPLTTFHSAIRALLDDEDHEVHSAYKITEKLKLVLNTGEISHHRLSADNSSIEPALTPDSDPTGYALPIKKTALMFRNSMSKDRAFALETEIYGLENGGMSGG